MELSSTPEITKNDSNKLSPFGSSINKSLLTPCRRIGLSRKRNTPSSIVDISVEEPGNSSTKKSCSTTPVNIKKSLSKRRSKVNFGSSPLSIPKDQSNDLVSSTVYSKALHMKSLVHDFSEDLHSKKSSVTERIEHNTCIVDTFHCALDAEVKYESLIGKGHFNTSSYLGKNCDIDDSVLKVENEETLKNKEICVKKLHTKSKSEVVLENLRECKISILKLNTQDINCIANHDLGNSNIAEDFSDDEVIGNIKKKRMVIISDDEDFCTVPKKYKNKVTEYIAENSTKIQQLKCDSPKVPMKETTNPSTVVYYISDEDDFTSTPDKDKVVRKDLIEKVKTLESEVEQKKKKLENLKQAAVYKTKHNIAELMKLVGIWKEGCVLGLNGLLTQLQTNRPMTMRKLLNDLHISDEVIIKLCLNISDD